ncbi:ATP-binding protein [Aneurinibacillus migulanus]|uniref:histidine kinase n=1 Tax=Aneurinibacillus migulanus TaxID=47500 RepID=A0A1G8QJS6_ANEMI|nr:ATP-binding protein [Aneurinibacillus migulanus]MED0892184.1 ATP-binding protein [Aneurinibacillus migulanus]MED1618793.1 ATP-binding protein [Aneurinibacillus migulanus]GED13465.1 two-component sensor histidine kinase [Aneurinibacillus migulanus]SDJ04901.1 two-component system, sporulation sensor kinase B [Aneurinibacillus migulanus]
MLGIERLLLNILFIILPIFLFQIFFAEKLFKGPKVWYTVVVGLFASATVILCMTFPFTFLPGYIFDMRSIPLIIATLYCGYKAGISTLAVLILYRYYVGGEGFYTTFYTYPIITAVALICVPRFRRAEKEKRETIALWLAILSSSLVLLMTLLLLPEENKIELKFVQFAFEYSLIQLGGIWIAVYLIENMRKNIMMQQEIQRAEKLYAMGELAASVAHEIRNPLTVVRGFLQLFGRQQIPVEKQGDYIDIMLKELNRAEEIISDYLTFARPQIESRERIEVGEQIRQIAGVMTSYALLKNVDIYTETEDHLFLELNRSKFSQCMINLMKNGVEAMPEGGTLTVRAFRQDKDVVIEIIDTGKGMSQEEIKRLGNPFYSTKEKGTGLGLMVCYRIIEAWEGKVEVRSEKEKGTHFSIILPALSDEL